MTTDADRHAPRGLLIRPRQQFRYAFVMVAGGILAQSLVVGVVSLFIHSAIGALIENHSLDAGVGEAIIHTINLSMGIVLLVAAAFAVVSVLIGVKLSHRIYGPMVPFTRHIDQLREGHYNVRMNLRKTDDLIELRDALNGLAETLEAKYPQTNRASGSR